MLSEKVLAERLCVSKTPVREALVQLQGLGLVTILPQRGGKVFIPTAEQVRQLCELRLILESSALRLSMQRERKGLLGGLRQVVARMERAFDAEKPTAYHALDSDFHETFFLYCGNELLRAQYLALNPKICALRTHLSLSSYLLNRSLEEHRLLIELVAANDLNSVLQLLSEHITRTFEWHSKAIDGQPVLGGELRSSRADAVGG
jgi:DNA-binding GntR family transcriptional regulator